MQTNDIQQVVSDFVRHMGADVSSVGLRHSHGRTIFDIQTKDSALLIGKRGETLRAMNTMVQRIAEHKELTQKDEHFSVDVNSYNQKRIEFLENQAQVLAQRAKTFKHEIEMPPMNPYERMIVHEALKNEPHISTESSGEGQLRHVVIRYKE